MNPNNVINIQQSRGVGTAIMILFGWWILLEWWMLLLAAWLVWLVIAAIVCCFKRGFFTRTWYYPWQAWMFGIR